MATETQRQRGQLRVKFGEKARTGVLALALVVGALLSGCSNTAELDSGVKLRVPVAVEAVARGRVEKTIAATGTLRSGNEGRVIAVTGGYLELGKAGGRRLAEGDTVAAGQSIATLTSEETRATLTTGKEARRLELSAAQADYERARKLHESGILAETDVISSQTRLAQAQYNYETAAAADEKNRLTAPVAGRLVELTREADGAWISPGTQIGWVMDFSTVVAEVRLSAGDFGAVERGMPARIVHYALQGESWSGTVDFISSALDSTTRSFRVDVAIQNREGKLRPGMFVKAEIVTSAKDNVVTVPRNLVLLRNNKKVVFVVEQQTARSREVALGLEGKDNVEVVSGLAEGDRIVNRGFETLEDGTLVRIGS